MKNTDDLSESNRRDFIKNTSLAALMALAGQKALAEDTAKTPANDPNALSKIPPPDPVKFGVIGLNNWGREILKQLSYMPSDPVPSAPVVALCDHYAPALRRAAKDLPAAKTYEDYKALLADPNVEAVIIATPTATHKEIALAALAAGKHVYCEAPLASTIDDTKAIARAARDAVKLVFQPGLQQRSHPEVAFLRPFLHTGALGQNVMVRAQWHKNDSWSRAATSPEREAELNQRLHQETSLGILGEEGIHQIDIVTHLMEKRPKAVTGFSSLILWGDDGRDVPDTVQTVFEYPGGANLMYDMTLCNSYEDVYEVYLGSYMAMWMRDFKAWMFKEVNAPNLSWETYARHDVFYKETGIGMIAGASKQNTLLGTAVSFEPYKYEPLYYALFSFLVNTGVQRTEVNKFSAIYPDADAKDVVEDLKSLKREPAATWQDGLEATVLAIKANEAAVKKEKITFEKEWFEL